MIKFEKVGFGELDFGDLFVWNGKTCLRVIPVMVEYSGCHDTIIAVNTESGESIYDGEIKTKVTKVNY